MRFNKKIIGIILATIMMVGTIVPAFAYDESQPEFYTERMEKIHWVADALRSLGFENGSDAQKAALAQCGAYWHEQAELRAEVIKKNQEEAQRQKEQEDSREYLGVFQITAYEWTGNPCANGRYPTVGYTVACNSLPLGTRVYIDGVGERVVEDRGASWHASNWMDLYLGDVSSCNAWGVQSRNVYIVR